MITGLLLALARISGETAPLLFTALNNQFFSLDMNAPMANLPVVIFQFAMSPYDNWVRLAWGGALLITLTVLFLNILARVFFRDKVQSGTLGVHCMPTTPILEEKTAIEVRNLSFFYGTFKGLMDINLNIAEHKVTAFIGPSGCGKSTLLRTFNRMYSLYPGQRAEGEIKLYGQNILDAGQDLNLLRARVGMVFQKPTPFPMSIYDNIAFGVRLYENLNRSDMDDRVEWALSKAAIWNEVKDKLGQSGLSLSGGQQQRLCIARGIAVKPSVLLLDEPTSALDPISTGKVEELISTLKNDYTVVIVTHNMQQAARVSDYTAYMYLGELIEFGQTEAIFMKPKRQETEDYITGRFG